MLYAILSDAMAGTIPYPMRIHPDTITRLRDFANTQRVSYDKAIELLLNNYDENGKDDNGMH